MLGPFPFCVSTHYVGGKNYDFLKIVLLFQRVNSLHAYTAGV